MKNLKVLLFILSFTQSFSQNIEVEYVVKLNKANDKSNIEPLEFKLLATKDKSLYKVEEKLSIENELKYNLAKAVFEGFNEYYINLSENEKITRKEFFSEFFIIKENDKYDWKIGKESKLINNYQCYKAITTIQQISGKTGDTINIEIIAWFCPELNYRFGPVGFYGLPGLILELHKGQTVYYAKKITFKKENPIIEAPIKGKKVTELQFLNISRKMINDTRN